MAGTIARNDSTALRRSNGPGSGSFDSGNISGPTTRSASVTGRAVRNTDPYQKCSSRNPPTMGPSAPPRANIVVHTAMAVIRSWSSVKMLRMIDIVEGSSVAPATPSSAREAINIGAVVDDAARIEARANPAEPHISRRRRPMRSPRLPIVTSSPASTNE